MAQQNAQMDEKTAGIDSNMNDKIDIECPKLSASEISKLEAECQELYKYECKSEVSKDGNSVVFYPSKHLNDENGNWAEKKSDNDFKFKDGKKLSRRESRKLILQEKRDKPGLISIGDPSVFKDICSTMECDRVESSCSDHDKELSARKILQFKYTDDSRIKHGFIQACEYAWSKHYPIVINVNHIWLIILQAVALHVDLNAETLRNKWVNHQAKLELEVKRNHFVKGNKNNRWSAVIEEFAEQIDQHTVAGSVDLLESNFSNSSVIDKIACKATIMDILKNYFTYIVRTRCGFPRITLNGTKQDWIKLYNKTKILLKTKVEPKFGQEWSKSLLPILARFVWAYEGNIDCLFWNSMIKRGGIIQSGGWEWFSGWINIFFPYIQSNVNEFCVPYETSQDYVKLGLKIAGKGNDIGFYPSGLASAPVIWNYFDLTYRLKFIAGIIGVAQDKDKKNEISTVVGWVIGEKTKENEEIVDTSVDNGKNQSDVKDDKMKDTNNSDNNDNNDNTGKHESDVTGHDNDNNDANDKDAATKTAIER